MRPDLVIAALIVGGAPARADSTVSALVAVDSYIATTPGITTDNAADVAWSAHLEWKDAARQVVLDAVDRESLIGTTPRRELHELSYVDRSIDHLAFTVGRFRVPGGFWLIADGGEIAARWSSLELGVFGGSRSFTNARVETLLTASPAPLPLVGAALTTRGPIQAALSYAATSDRVEIYRGLGVSDNIKTPEQFVDAELLAPIGDHLYITGGATAGSRYLVSYATTPARIADNPQLDNIWFGSQAVYGLVDWRMGELRIDGTAAAMRTKLGQVADAAALAALDGSFVEATLRATWRRGRAWRVDARYRARVFGDHRYAQRAQVTAQWRRGMLDVQLGAGFDSDQGAGTLPGLANTRTLLYRASIGLKTARAELAIGAAAVAAIGDEVSTNPGDEVDDQRAPYTLEARSYGFARTFLTHGAWFGGFDFELDLHGAGARALIQIGWSR